MQRLLVVALLCVCVVSAKYASPRRIRRNTYTGNWQAWNPWTPCSEACGEGSRLRTRACSGQGQCDGSAQETDNCPDNPPCAAEWMEWSEWCPCSQPCGGGVQDRERFCSIDGECTGDEKEIRECNEQSCCQAWGAWSACSQTCDGDVATKTRTRDCSPNNAANEPVQDTAKCADLPLCAMWEEWGPWCQCSAPCNGGKTHRERFCTVDGACVGESKEEKDCNTDPCCLEWQTWQACSATCGEGTRTRIRDCGANVASEPVQASEPCANLPACAHWLEWGPWCQCSEPCGGGKRHRERFCSVDGECVGLGEAKEEECCNEQPCEWNEWNPWTTCSATCGRGVQQRSRACGGNMGCDGAASESQPCNAPAACPMCSGWGRWGPCENGEKKRKRRCRQSTGSYAMTEEFQTQPC